MPRTPGGLLLLNGQALFDAIDAAAELIEPLAVLLCLTRCGLRLRQGLLGRAVGLLEP
ncbi:hypothetical protein KV697_19330 [Sphingomonas sanguinis]|nr:hypothetical protein KV697_19330 [Sphingomonas sanguinis]